MIALPDQIEQLRVINALRLATAMVLSICLAVLLGMDTGVFAIFPILVIAFMIHDESPLAGLSLVVGSALGAVISFVTIDLLLTARPLFLAATLIETTLLGYWAAQGFRNRWPWGFGGFFAVLIVAGAAFSAISEAGLGEQVAFRWTLEIALGVAVAWVVMLGLRPSPTGRDLGERCSGIAHECARLLTKTADRLESGQHVSYHSSPVSLMNFGKWRLELNKLRWRFHGDPESYEAIQQRMYTLMLAYINVRHLERTLEDLPNGKELSATRHAMVTILRDLAHAIEQPSDTGTLDDAVSGIDRDAAGIAANLGAGADDALRLPGKLFAFTTAARELRRDIGALAKPSLSEAPITAEAPPAGQTGWIARDSLKAALKLSLGIAIVLLLHAVPVVPTGDYLVLGLVVVLAQPNLGKSHLRVRLWFPGVLAGTAFALLGLVVISVAPHFLLLLACLFAGFLIGAYVGGGRDRISYSGFQICVAIAVILGTAAFPLATVISAEQRVLGGILGFAVAFLMARYIWPEHPADLLRRSFAANLRATPLALTRICNSKDADPAALNAHLIRQQTDVQTDFALLYDFSYMMARMVPNRYDYRWMTHATGNMFHQLWTLHQALARLENPAIRQAMIQPTKSVLEQIGALADTLADEITTGDQSQNETIAARLDALDRAIDGVELPPASSADIQRAHYFGVNFVREMRDQLALVFSSVESHNSSVLPETSQLAFTYEGVRE